MSIGSLKAWDGSSWVEVPTEAGRLKQWDGSSWKETSRVHAWDGSQWVLIWEPSSSLPPGTYIVENSGHTVSSTQFTFINFNDGRLDPYRGRVVSARVRVSWLTSTSYSWTVRTLAPSGNIDHSRSKLPEYAGRTIFHDLSQAQADSLSLDADRLRFWKPAGVGWNVEIQANVALELTIV